MYQHILVAIDGSELSAHALQAAVGLAKTHQARLRIVHVVDVVSFNWEGEFEYGDMTEVQNRLRQTGQKVLDKAEGVAREAGVETEAALLQVETLGQRVSDMIVEEAKRWPADLIVLGTHGRRGLHKWLLGSVAEAVGRCAEVPVHLVR